MYTTLANGIKVFYREAGERSNPTIVLLHGFPSSSFQYRNLIPLLAGKYHVIAPDLPGFGFTEVPASAKFQYTFANLATTVAEFLDAHQISSFAVYIFDYGAPTALRLALQRPKAIRGIVSQNGNAYVEGLGDFWVPLKKYWASGAAEDREALKPFFSRDVTYSQYMGGEDEYHCDRVIDPAAPELDYHLMLREGNHETQLDLFYDYRTNVDLYPQFQEYLRTSQVPVLAIWGKNDPIFIPPGAEAFRRDRPDAVVKFLDAGHFAVESHPREIADAMLAFLHNRVDPARESEWLPCSPDEQ